MPESSIEQDRLLNTSGGKGEEICSYLIRELELPETVRKFTVTFEVKSAVKVECEYYPIENND